MASDADGQTPKLPDSRSKDFQGTNLEWLYGTSGTPAQPPHDTSAIQRVVDELPGESNDPEPIESKANARCTHTPAYEIEDELKASSVKAEPVGATPADAPKAPRRTNTPAYDAEELPRPTAKAEPRSTRQPSPSPRPSARPVRAPRPSVERPKPSSGSTAARPRSFRLGRTLGLVLLAWIVFLVAVPVLTMTSMDTVEATPAGSRPGRHPGTTFLLVGTDSRENLSQAEKDRLGTGDAEGHRADTIMMLYKPPKGRSVLISLPRDSYVTIPGYGRDKLNAAYAYGGPELLVNTVEQVSDVKIDGYLEIGFGGFAAMVDAVGGVNVCLSEPMKDELAKIDLPAGCQDLKGQDALGYVRTRYNDPEGDIGRAKRQREVVGKVIDKVVSPASVINPVRYYSINRAVGKTLTRGKDTSVGTLANAGFGLVNVAGDKGLQFVIPLSRVDGIADDGGSVVIWDREQAMALFKDINAGDTSTMDRYVAK